jgi:hypothetical protein
MRSIFFAKMGFKRLASSVLMGIGAAAIGGNALADVSSWVTTSAPDIVPDPGAAGPLSTYEVEYADGATSSTIGRHGYLVAPTDALASQEAVKRPVVVFLHGAYDTCMINGVPSDPIPYTCPVANRIPSYKGYLGIQRRLATRGYISVSIDASETHGDLPDGPNQHLSLLSSWADAAPSTFLMWVARNADFNKVVLVGHSVGVTSVNTAAYQNKIQQSSGTSMPSWRVAGQVLLSGGLLSPIASTVGVHTLRWMAGCERISNWNTSAQQSLDEDAHHDQVTLRSSILVRGANHSYSNSVWGDYDDRYPETPPVRQDIECYFTDANGQLTANPSARLSLNSQQSILKAYVTAAVSAFVSDDKNAWNAIDGTPGHMPSSGAAGTAGPEIRVAGKGRRRNDFVQFAYDKLNVSGSGNIAAGICSSSNVATDTCAGPNLSGSQRSQFLIDDAFTSARPLVSAKWSALGGQISIAHKATYKDGLLEVMLSGRQLGLRIAQLPTTALTRQQPIAMNVKLRDVGGHVLDLGNVTVNPLATLANVGPVWAQEVRIPVPRSASFDFTSVVSLDLTPLAPSSGQFWVVDAFGYYPNN